SKTPAFPRGRSAAKNGKALEDSLTSRGAKDVDRFQVAEGPGLAEEAERRRVAGKVMFAKCESLPVHLSRGWLAPSSSFVVAPASAGMNPDKAARQGAIMPAKPWRSSYPIRVRLLWRTLRPLAPLYWML